MDNSKMNNPSSLLSTLLTGLMLWVSLSGCQESHQADKNKPELPTATVTLGKVTETDTFSRVEVTGTLQAVRQASISARISGQIVELPVFLGSSVKKDDLLVKISAGEMTAKLLQAQAQLEQAKRNLAREKKLQKQGASTPETVKSLQDIVNISKAAYQEAKTMLDYSIITAPFDGTIMKKMANIGDLASPGTPLLQVVNEAHLQVVAQIPEALIASISKGDTLKVTIPAADLHTEAVVSEVAPSADPLSRTAPVKLDIKSSSRLRPGQFARVSIPNASRKGLMVPKESVVVFGQMNKIFMIQDNRAALRLVKTGATTDSMVEILAGLNKDDQIVVQGAKKLLNGQPLNIEK
ncbi:MAG: efflux RND transporter periplasmic adaptor subunit [Thermodesulfobacteriota bacterium]